MPGTHRSHPIGTPFDQHRSKIGRKLSTVSAYLQLPQSRQQQAYDAIAQVLPETVEIAADITVHLARRLSE